MSEQEKAKTISIVTNSVPRYRTKFYSSIQASARYRIKIYASSFHSSPVPDQHRVPLLTFSREILAFQFLPMLDIARSDAVVFMGNPRYLSTVVASIILRMLGKTVIIWGHAHTAGSSIIGEFIRLQWWRLFSNLLVYTDNEREILSEKLGHRYEITALNNGLDQEEINTASQMWSAECLKVWREKHGLTDKKIVLSCARLISKNQLHWFPRVLKQVCAAHPEVVWAVIGAGPERQRIEIAAKRYGVEHSVMFVGKLEEESDIAPWFLSSTCLVHPGSIGLTLLHAFGYGLPVVTHSSPSNHMPEFAAFEDYKNGLLYREGDSCGCATKILALIDNPRLFGNLSALALETARSRYNVSIMCERFLAAIDRVIQAHPYRNMQPLDQRKCGKI